MPDNKPLECQPPLPTAAEDDLINKRKLFLDLLMDEYKSESLRATEVDNKAFRSLSASAFFFAVMALSVNFSSSDILPHFLSNDILLRFLQPLFLVTSLATWVLSYFSFSLISFEKLSLSNKDFASTENKSLLNIYDDLCAGYLELNAKLHASLKKKTCLLKDAQRSLLLSGILAFIMAGYVLYKYSKY